MKGIIPLFVFIGLLFSHCSKDEKLTHFIKAKTFTINTPNGWTLIEDQGIDTYIGRITDGKTTIYFDQGYLSFGQLDNIQKNGNTIYLTKTNVNGIPAIIHKENTPDESPVNKTRLSVYLDSGKKQNRLYVFNSNDDQFFINIFRSHRFL